MYVFFSFDATILVNKEVYISKIEFFLKKKTTRIRQRPLAVLVCSELPEIGVQLTFSSETPDPPETACK